MRYQTKICTLLCAVVALPTFAATTKLDLRAGYNINSESKDTRVKFAHNFDNGYYFGAEAAQAHNDSYFGANDSKSTETKGVRASYQEFEASKKLSINEKTFWAPGMFIVVTGSATEYRPYLKWGTKFENGLAFTARYRYNWSNDANGKTYLDGSGTTRGASHQFDLWFAKQFGNIEFVYNPRYRFQDGVNQGNGRDNYWEHTLDVNYKYSDSLTPYLELASLDKTYLNNSGNHENDYAVRVGFVFKL